MARLSCLLLWAGLALAASAGTRGQPSPSTAVTAAQEKLQSAAKEDEDAHEKAGCFCQTNLAEKQQTVENMQSQQTQLSHDIDESTARISQLDVEVKMHSEELETSSSALSTAEAIRAKDSQRFADEESSHTVSIDQLQSALTALNNHGAAAALIAVSSKTTRQTPFTLLMEQRLEGKSSPDQISGVLKHMVTTFSGDLQALRDDEVEAKNRHEGLVAAKSQEITSQRKHMLGKQQRLAKTKVQVNFNSQIKERSDKLLEANVQVLNSLKQLCQKSDDSFTTRHEAVQAEIVALSGAQAELAGAAFLSVGDRARGDGAEKICSASLEFVEKGWKQRAQAACKQARKDGTSNKQGAADTIEELETDIREAQDEAARKQDDCTNEIQGARSEAANAANANNAEANFVGSEQQSAEEQIQDMTSQSEHADKAKSDYEQVSMAQQKAIQALRVATTQGKEVLERAAGRAGQSAAMKINEAIGLSEKLMTEADSFGGALQSEKDEISSLWDNVRLTAGKVLIPLRLMKADSEEDAIAIKENGEEHQQALAPKCDAVHLAAKVAKFKNYRSLLGKAAESLAWETLR